jgi:hypothetical protein
MGEGLMRLFEGAVWLTIGLLAIFLMSVSWYVAARALWEWVTL